MEPDVEDPLTKWQLAAAARANENEAMREVRKLHESAECLEAGFEATAAAVAALLARLEAVEQRLAAVEGRRAMRSDKVRSKPVVAVLADFEGPRRVENDKTVHYSQPLITTTP